VTGHVTLEGTTYPVEYFGSGLVTAPTLILPPLIPPPPPPPGTGTFVVTETFILPATLQASLTACAADPFSLRCASPPDNLAEISINLPGELTVNLNLFYFDGFVSGDPPPETEISELFVSTPIPEPSSLWLTCAVIAIAIAARPRCGTP
jgi:hypothetical protein